MEAEKGKKDRRRRSQKRTPKYSSPQAVIASGIVEGEVRAIGEDTEGRDDSENIDGHQDKGLTPGCSTDGLSHEVAMAEGLESPVRIEEDGREEEGEEGRSPVRIPTPVVVSKAENRSMS